MKAKICGITNLEDALFAANNGAWAIGFNFYKQSPRYISFNKAKDIISQLPNNIIKIGILIDFTEKEALYAQKLCDFLQVYQNYAPFLVNKGNLILVLRSMTRCELLKHEILQKYEYVILDSPASNDNLLGGTGRLANWELAKELAKDYKLILAGGLNINNINKAINDVNPFAVDVASGVESSPGIKDKMLVKNFLMECRNDN